MWFGLCSRSWTPYNNDDYAIPLAAQTAISNAMAFKEKVLGSKINGEHLLIYSNQIPTIHEIAYDFVAMGPDGFKKPTTPGRKGDKTVPEFSARGVLL